MTSESVHLILRDSAYARQFLREHPGCRVVQTLLNRYFLIQAPARDAQSAAFPPPMLLQPLGRREGGGGSPAVPAAMPGLTGQGVLIGIVDTGIDPALDIFRRGGESRLLALYDQTAPGSPPAGFACGAHFSRGQIQSLLAGDPPASFRDPLGHGTFLASVAAGCGGGFLGAAPEALLAAVKLRPAGPWACGRLGMDPDRADLFSDADVALGVEFVREQARRAGLPAVICLGLGAQFGSHDGSSVLEQYLGDVAALPGVCLCAAAGDEGRRHRQVRGRLGADGDDQTVDLRVGDAAGTIAAGLWSAAADALTLSIRAPSGQLTPPVPLRPGARVRQTADRAEAEVESFSGEYGTMTLLRLTGARDGTWSLILHGKAVQDGQYHAWLCPAGPVVPEAEFLESDPSCTVTIPGTMVGGIICGAWDSVRDVLWEDSSWGPTRLPRMAPDLTAPGVRIEGYFPDGPGAMSGTAVAAAVTAGVCAQLCQRYTQRGRTPDTYALRSDLIRGCRRRECLDYPNPQWGFGVLDAPQTLLLEDK